MGGCTSSPSVAGAFTGLDRVFVTGAGSEKCNGVYYQVLAQTPSSYPGWRKWTPVEHNSAHVFRNDAGFTMTREIVSPTCVGWVIGKGDVAFYGLMSSSHVAPAGQWGWAPEFEGESPCPIVALHPRDAEQTNMRGGLGNRTASRISIEMPAAAQKSAHGAVSTSTAFTKDSSSDFFPVSPTPSQRAIARRSKNAAPAHAWKTPKRSVSLRKKLTENTNRGSVENEEYRQALHHAIKLNRESSAERLESFRAKRDERYRYYQSRLARGNRRAPLGALGNDENSSPSSGYV